jgi:hypothetical protein
MVNEQSFAIVVPGVPLRAPPRASAILRSAADAMSSHRADGLGIAKDPWECGSQRPTVWGGEGLDGLGWSAIDRDADFQVSGSTHEDPPPLPDLPANF